MEYWRLYLVGPVFADYPSGKYRQFVGATQDSMPTQNSISAWLLTFY